MNKKTTDTPLQKADVFAIESVAIEQYLSVVLVVDNSLKAQEPALLNFTVLSRVPNCFTNTWSRLNR